MDTKKLIAQAFIFVTLFGCPAVSMAQVDDGDGYTNAQCIECHEEMTDDDALSVHARIECLSCDTQAVEEDHEQVAPVDCRQCRARLVLRCDRHDDPARCVCDADSLYAHVGCHHVPHLPDGQCPVESTRPVA